ncbi:hypothetical protein [Salipiger aestuarii]|uniref:Uncharacterized protein n=1 Tax=Salipiger aestuarii TaxID=568098 RepID=A0A327XGT1_9RHOB|nr:hypothetical protein [Salipiger aestuarii]RAK07157.1 hypothetical protein ATI53_11072 [Salipiger aestuarii]
MSLEFSTLKCHIIGDSHVHSLRAAASQLKDIDFSLGTIQPIGSANDFYESFFSVEDNRIRLTKPKMVERLNGFLCNPQGELYKPDGSLIFLSAGFHTLVFLNSKRWDTHRHWKVMSSSMKQPLTESEFSAMVEDLHRHLLTFLSKAKTLGYNFCILSSPPPTKRFIDRLTEKQWTTDEIVFLDSAFRGVMSSRLQATGVPVVSPPGDVTMDGFLKDDFVTADPSDTHHGNVEYSKLFLRRISDFVKHSNYTTD